MDSPAELSDSATLIESLPLPPASKFVLAPISNSALAPASPTKLDWAEDSEKLECDILKRLREPQPKPRPKQNVQVANYRTTECRNFSRNGTCTYGRHCDFLHTAPPGATQPARRDRRRPRPATQNGAFAPAPYPAPVPAWARTPPSPCQVDGVRKPVEPTTPATPQSPAPTLVVPVPYPVPLPLVPPMFYGSAYALPTERRGSAVSVDIDPTRMPAPVQAQKSIYYRTKPCKYWSASGGVCPKGDKCTFIHDPNLGVAAPAVQQPSRPASSQGKSTQPADHVNGKEAAKEPAHPLWRVLSGGVTLASMTARNAENESSDEDDDAIFTALSLAQLPANDPRRPNLQLVTGTPVAAFGTPFPSPAAFPAGAAASVSPYSYPGPQPMFAFAYPGFAQPACAPTPAATDAIQIDVSCAADQAEDVTQYLADHGVDVSAMDFTTSADDDDGAAMDIEVATPDEWTHSADDEPERVLRRRSALPVLSTGPHIRIGDAVLVDAHIAGARTAPGTPLRAARELPNLFAAEA